MVFSAEEYAKFFLFNSGMRLDDFDLKLYSWQELVLAFSLSYEFVIIDDAITENSDRVVPLA